MIFPNHRLARPICPVFEFILTHPETLTLAIGYELLHRTRATLIIDKAVN
jgi:hypothetical protein